MPKRIPHLAETILTQATQLFSRHGYDAVDMKMVAQASGTSVGNLYNYHASKPDLFLAVGNRWRKRILEACQEILRSPLERSAKILAILSRLYDDVASWHGLWREFSAGREERSKLWDAKAKRAKGHPLGLSAEELAMMNELEVLIVGTASPDNVSRWAMLVITSTIQLASRHPDHREENWKFLENLVGKL